MPLGGPLGLHLWLSVLVLQAFTPTMENMYDFKDILPYVNLLIN